MQVFLRSLIAVFILLLLVSCGGIKSSPPVVDRGEPRVQKQRYRVVKRGDTLYSIAWAIGVDHRILARWNRIRPPYIIKPGQRILLSTRGYKRRRSAKYRWRIYKVKRGDTLYSIARKHGLSSSRLAAINRIRTPYVITPGQKLRLSKSRRSSAVRTPRYSRRDSRTRKKPVSLSTKTRIRGWIWPTKGRVIRQFGVRRNKGIDIAGRRGQAIYAVAAGKVVYSGKSLPEYGNLIIIKHNADYLSAYAHINGTYVREGDVIRKGRKIAAMGSSGTDSVKLHLEIRYNGIPINPLRLLPK